jgi:cell division protease FtsH
MKDFIKNFLIILAALILIVVIWSQFGIKTKVLKPEEISITQLMSEISSSSIKEVVQQGNVLKSQPIDPKIAPRVTNIDTTVSFPELMKDYGVSSEIIKTVKFTVGNDSSWKFWLINIVLPLLIPLLLILGFMYMMSRSVAGANNKAMGFGQSNPRMNAPENKDKKTFADVAGAVEAKEELVEIVDFLKNPKKFADMGAKIPKGVLLTGSPGTGKTLLAKAVAGEANVPFFHMSGSEFVEMFVGVGASRVRDLFSKAKKAAPAIIFIDEIDAVGRRRGAGLGGGHDEREQTLNQILVEMDGFEPNSGVIIMAATNRPDVLDPALLRPGRFDRRVTIDLPDIKDREEILAVHAVGKPIASSVSLRRVAERTPGFSGADLANLLNEAAILTVRKGLSQITENEILPSIEKVLLGPERKSRVITEHDKKVVAYHEAGHALVGYVLPNSDSIRKVSIISRGSAGGYTLKMPEQDKRFPNFAEFRDDLAMALGGYVVEKMIFGEDKVSTGPSSDLRNATKLARSMIMQYGMSKNLGPRTFGEHEEMVFLGREIHEERDYSDKTAEEIDEEIKRLIMEAENRARAVITKHKSKLEKLVAALVEKETVEEGEIRMILGEDVYKTETI